MHHSGTTHTPMHTYTQVHTGTHSSFWYFCPMSSSAFRCHLPLLRSRGHFSRLFQSLLLIPQVSPNITSSEMTPNLAGWHSLSLSSRFCSVLFLSESESEVAQLYPTLCDPMDCGPPGSSVHGILQARILEWVAIPFSRESSRPRDWTQVSRIADRRFNLWATREALKITWNHSTDVSAYDLFNPQEYRSWRTEPRSRSVDVPRVQKKVWY